MKVAVSHQERQAASHPSHVQRLNVSLREKHTIVPTPAPEPWLRDLAGGQKQAIPYRGPHFFPKELTFSAKRVEKLKPKGALRNSAGCVKGN